MKSNKKYYVSVIIPVYNGEEFLKETLDSILNSSLKEIEIVIIDDGSKDSSAKICKDLMDSNDNILYIKKENGGIVSARNLGLELASGEYISFCDQDDLVNKDMYSLLLKTLKENDGDIAICGTSRYINNQEIPLEKFADKVIPEEEINREIIEPVLFYGSDLGRAPSERWVGSIWKCMVLRELIVSNNIRFRRYVDFEDDLLFFLDIMLHAKKVCTLSYMGYKWRINLQSETYNWKYIEGFERKYMQFIDDVICMLKKSNYDNSILTHYKNYQVCTMFEQLLLNEGSCKNDRRLFEKLKHIKKIIYQNNFKEVILFRKHIWKSSIRKKVALSLLAHRCWMMSYFWVVEYKRIRERAIKGKTWFFIEEKVKGLVGKKIGEDNE